MEGKPVHIKKANEKDVELIARLSSETFYESFAAQNTKEDMEKYLEEKFNDHYIENELKDKFTVFFVAYFDDVAVGYTKLRENKAPEGLECKKPLEIERIYVYKAYQNKKVGAVLMQNNIDHAFRNGFDMIWLGVWEHNLPSIEFYKKWGFEIFGKHIFRLGDDDQNDLLMKKKLK
jgi:ribosomal protein S18 acetylase RimI-like enzyme